MQIKVLITKIIITVFFIILLSYILNFYHLNHNYMKSLIDSKNNIIVEGMTAPRGRIYDKNGIVLVDNIMINNLIFINLKGIDKIGVAKRLANIFEFEKPTEKEIISWYKDTKNTSKMLSENEKYEIKTRKSTFDELIDNKIISLIDSISDEELNIIKAYVLLNSGYEKSPKIIREDLTDEEVNLITLENIPGLIIEPSFKRYYPYGSVLQAIFGKIGKITKEEKEEYLKEGYFLDDIVGLSYLEKQYDYFLKGTKAKYSVNSDNSLTLIEKEKIGNDLYLAIDINIQLKIEEIIEKNLKKAKSYPNTDNFTDSFVILSNPKTGEIRAISGKRILENGEFSDIPLGCLTSSFTMGSVIKGATISVALKNNIFDPNEKILDSCIKLQNMNPKCSWKRLGYIDAVKALEQSSNYYQFLLAIKMLGLNYTYDMDFDVTKDDFNIYRDMLASYGLGIKTGIDLPNEKIGLIGDKISSDLYLNLAIGQYDTYTPIELITYINTIADKGNRRKPYLVETIRNHGNIIWQNDREIILKTGLTEEDYDIIFHGFYNVINNKEGTGYGLMNQELNPAGKTGTSESFYDANNDGIIDTSTITLTMAGFFPYDNPKYSMIIVSPNVSTPSDKSDYVYPLTYYLSREITDFMFENM